VVDAGAAVAGWQGQAGEGVGDLQVLVGAQDGAHGITGWSVGNAGVGSERGVADAVGALAGLGVGDLGAGEGNGDAAGVSHGV